MGALKFAGRWSFPRNLAILATGEAISRAITLAAFVHLARVFEPAVYGLVELTLSVMMFLTLAVDQGLGTLGTRELARHPEKGESLVRRIMSAQ